MSKLQNTKAILEALIECYSDDLFELLDLLDGLYCEVELDNSGVCREIWKAQEKIVRKLKEKNICPNCGSELDFEHDSDYDTYVPYGDTTVLESEGGFFTCPNCGFRKED